MSAETLLDGGAQELTFFLACSVYYWGRSGSKVRGHGATHTAKISADAVENLFLL